MDHVNPTRMELLTKRAEIKLAEQGRELLKQKRNALWKELKKSIDVVMQESSELDRVAAEATRALAMAEAMDGREAVASAGIAASRRKASINVRPATVMGLAVPEIEREKLIRPCTERGYSLASTSARIDDAAERFEEELEILIEVAAVEMRLRRLLEEIRKTTIRINSLDVVLLPRLTATRDYIESLLSEREREDAFRLKRVKQSLTLKHQTE
ncbi:MAG TPA: V-type ATP synthase subunit D [Blastocatellia bacterium]|nr:V-type ATP synthase subunit D [Blastocatellia bacterium]